MALLLIDEGREARLHRHQIPMIFSLSVSITVPFLFSISLGQIYRRHFFRGCSPALQCLFASEQIKIHLEKTPVDFVLANYYLATIWGQLSEGALRFKIQVEQFALGEERK